MNTCDHQGEEVFDSRGTFEQVCWCLVILWLQYNVAPYYITV